MRVIANTETASQFPWPESCNIQGGSSGVVIVTDGDTYVTAFVEAFPRDPNTFLRGEAASIQEAERDCWEQYQTMLACEHGSYEPRQYTNGSGYCVSCGTWFSDVLEPAPEDPDRALSPLELALLGDADAAMGIIRAMDAARGTNLADALNDLTATSDGDDQ